MLKITVDSNVIISSLLKKDSVPARVISYILNECQLYISQFILDELEEVLKRPKVKSVVGWNTNRIELYLAGLEEAGIMVNNLPELKLISEDPSDNNVLACAVAARVDYLISGDNHLRKLGSYEGIKILSPSEFLEIL